MPITILIADDHSLFRHGLCLAISAEPDLQIIAEAGNGEEALQQIVLLSPDIAILDIDMPRRDGFAVVRELNRLRSTVGIIFLALHSGFDLLEEALAIGVRGYFLKSSAAIDIAEGVRRVASGDSYFSEEVQQLRRRGK